MNENRTIGTLADVRGLIEQAGPTGTRLSDMVSAINRICEMAGTTPASVRESISLITAGSARTSNFQPEISVVG
jgi:hypothetical protein